MPLDPERSGADLTPPWAAPAEMPWGAGDASRPRVSRRGYASRFEDDLDAADVWADDDADELSDRTRWRRRHPPAVRLIGAVLAASLLLATVGTTIGVLLGGSSSSVLLRTTVLSVRPLRTPHGTGGGGEALVTFVVEEPAHASGAAPCRISVTSAGRPLGGRSGFLSAGLSGRQQVRVRVPLDRPVPAGARAAAAVVCRVGVDTPAGAD